MSGAEAEAIATLPQSIQTLMIVNPILMALVVALLSVVAWFIYQVKKDSDRRDEDHEARIQRERDDREDAIQRLRNEQSQAIKSVERDLNRYKADAPERFVLRSDFTQQMARQDKLLRVINNNVMELNKSVSKIVGNQEGRDAEKTK